MVTSSATSHRIVGTAAFAAFLATFNETFLNVAFFPIMDNLGVGVATVQWLATAYMLSAAIMIPVSAFLYRSIPTRRLFLIAVGLLVLGSVTGALATGFPLLLVGRVVQALGTGMLIPVGMNITLEVAPREKIGLYMGIMGAMTTLGPSSSVIVSGFLLSFFTWHSLLWTFAGLATLCFICGAIFLPKTIARLSHPRLDGPSVVVVALALSLLLYGVSSIFSGSPFIALVAVVLGAALMGLFLSRQRGLPEPLMDLAPLSSPPFSLGVAINMIALVLIFGMNIILPLYMQGGLGATSLGAALTLFPAILLSCVVAPLAGRVYDRRGASLLLPLGFFAMFIFTLALPLGSRGSSFIPLALLYIPVICGSALIIGPVQSYALSSVDGDHHPHAVTVMSTGFQIAGCIGSSLFSGVYAAFLSIQSDGGAPSTVASKGAFLAPVLAGACFAALGFVFALRIRSAESTPSLISPGEK